MTNSRYLDRRRFLKGAGTYAVGCVVTGLSGRHVKATSPMRLGGPVFLKSEDPYELAQAHRDLEGRKTTGSTVLLP